MSRSSLNFYDNTSLLKLLPSNDFTFRNVPFTFEVWIRLNSLHSSWNNLYAHEQAYISGAANNNVTLLFDKGSSSGRLEFQNNSTEIGFIGGNPTPGVWEHYALVWYSNNTVKAFKNFVQFGNTVSSTHADTRLANFIIGNAQGATPSWTRVFPGLMRHIRLSVGISRSPSEFITDLNSPAVSLDSYTKIYIPGIDNSNDLTGKVVYNQLVSQYYEYELNIVNENGIVSRNINKDYYNQNSNVTLTATPNEGYVFSGWSGDASGITNPLTVTMDADKNITANFTLEGQTKKFNKYKGKLDLYKSLQTEDELKKVQLFNNFNFKRK